jgi:hypothetical protein
LNVDVNGDGYPDVSDICGELYDEAAKCNKYMGNAGDYAVRQSNLNASIIITKNHANAVAHCAIFFAFFSKKSDNQEKQESTVCGFIHNLITNSYDEYGEIILRNSDGWMSYVPNIDRMPQWQKYMVAFSVFSVVGLFAYACYLHRQLTQRKFVWYPRGRKGYSNYPGMEPAPISARLNSGIIQGRSRSSNDFDMKDGGTLS